MSARWIVAIAVGLTGVVVTNTGSIGASQAQPNGATTQRLARTTTPADIGDLADQRLRDLANQAVTTANRRTESSGVIAEPTVSVEVFGAATTEIAAAVVQVGGAITGSVDGQVVQATVPVSRLAELGRHRSVERMQAPRRVTRAPRPVNRRSIEAGFGPTVGQNVAKSGADVWQAGGVDGSVKVGIIDYFDLGLWVPAEEGPRPDTQAPAAVDPNGHSVGRSFCLDTSGVAPNFCPLAADGVNDGNGDEHGVAVSQVVKDMAPAAELYIAEVATVSDLRAAIDWFALNNVPIVTRSLGAAYDGPGDGTGALDSVVDYAAARGIAWFNSAGNEAVDGYVRTTVPASLASTGGYIDFDNGPGVDTYLRISGSCIGFDGIRWSDWNLPASQRTDYSVELYEPRTNPDSANGENFNPTNLALLATGDDSQAAGAPPLEGADSSVCPVNNFGFAGGISYLRVKRLSGTPAVGPLDILEVATSFGVMEVDRSQAAYSAAKPVVDSANPALVAVGAIDPAIPVPNTDLIAYYSSQGPTNDGRIKPDVSATSCVTSTIYAPDCFNGTSAASPTAAGFAALLLDAGVAVGGAHLAAAVKHFVTDWNFDKNLLNTPDGPDNKYGTGQVTLPTLPEKLSTVPSRYVPVTPLRVFDTRNVGSGGSRRTYDIIDFTLPSSVAGATAVALNVTSVGAITPGFIQVVPFLAAPLGGSSSINVSVAALPIPNFVIVPLGASQKISVYVPTGGNIALDLLGSFQPTTIAAPPAAGRFVPINPERQLDTRSTNLVPAGWVAHKPNNENVVLKLPVTSAVPAAGVAALVLNVTSTQADAAGWLRAQPSGTTPLTTSTVNYVKNTDSANTVIVPLGADGTVTIYTSVGSHIIADVAGYITSGTAPVSSQGLFVPVITTRTYDSRNPGQGALAISGSRSVNLGGLAAGLWPNPGTGNWVDFNVRPPSAVSLNLTAANEQNFGFLTAYPTGGAFPPTSSLNYQPAAAVANAALVKLGTGGAMTVFSSAQSDFLLDVNGYFTGP